MQKENKCSPNSAEAAEDYEIFYNWNGEDKRLIKVHTDDIVGKILKKY